MRSRNLDPAQSHSVSLEPLKHDEQLLGAAEREGLLDGYCWTTLLCVIECCCEQCPFAACCPVLCAL
jgi:hypothetical protein